MPGDTYTDSIELVNSNKKNAKYYLTIGTNEQGQKEIELLKRVKLTITNKNGDVLYDGGLIREEKILLGEYDINDRDKFDFKISFPTNLGNEFENLNPDLFLIFSADTKEENADKHSDTIKTGDRIDYLIVIFAISTIGFIVACILYYKEKKSFQK